MGSHQPVQLTATLVPNSITRSPRVRRQVSPATCAPQKVHDKAAMEMYGYHRRPQSAHIQRSIDERETALYNARRYGAKPPPTAQYRLPLGPNGAEGSQQFAAYNAELANPGSILKAAGGDKKKK